MGSSNTDVLNYAKEARAKFCTGLLDPSSDADWNTYVQTIEQLGAAAWTKAAQSVYDRFMSN